MVVGILVVVEEDGVVICRCLCSCLVFWYLSLSTTIVSWWTARLVTLFCSMSAASCTGPLCLLYLSFFSNIWCWWAIGLVDFLCLRRFKAYSTFLLLQQLFVGVWAAGLVALFGPPKCLMIVSL